MSDFVASFLGLVIAKPLATHQRCKTLPTRPTRNTLRAMLVVVIHLSNLSSAWMGLFQLASLGE